MPFWGGVLYPIKGGAEIFGKSRKSLVPIDWSNSFKCQNVLLVLKTLWQYWNYWCKNAPFIFRPILFMECLVLQLKINGSSFKKNVCNLKSSW